MYTIGPINHGPPYYCREILLLWATYNETEKAQQRIKLSENSWVKQVKTPAYRVREHNHTIINSQTRK